jgi:hypothetical protein
VAELKTQDIHARQLPLGTAAAARRAPHHS